MIRVLELIDGGFIGGGQTHILSLVKCLEKDKFNPVIAASSDGEFKKISEKNGYEFRDIELPKVYRSKYLNELEEIVNKDSINVIHSHGGVAGMYARFYKKRNKNVKVIHTIHGIHYVNSGNSFRKLFSKTIEQYLVPYTDRFICVSDADLETALENKIVREDKSVVIRNGIDVKRFASRNRNEDLLEKYGIGKTDLIIGNISRFDFQKNQRFIIKNSIELLERYPQCKILLAGDGKYLEECKIRAARSDYGERFIFTGEINDPEEYYSLMDIFVFPSLWEGLSISLIEAMASSSCILASDIPANKELVKDNSNGLIFDVNDVPDFKQKLKNLVTDKKLRRSLSEKAALDSVYYSETDMTKMIEEEYIKLQT